MSASNRSLARIRKQLTAMRALASRTEPELLAVAPCSGWSPSEHLDHSIKVTASIVSRLLDLDAPRGARGVSAVGRLIMLVGRIPRGRGRSPERLTGTRQTAADLQASLTKLERKLDLLAAQHLEPARGPIVPHPRFGGLTPPHALRFAEIHTDHHLRIIDDILAAAR
ncbi:MAG TPA: DinB family protein [Thermoanaerobaculia bacterium]|nr:DinB family protein [Thermoanaerobaculia bacterium]